MNKIKVYGAGKTQESAQWLTLMKETSDIEWTNSWPSLHGKIADIADNARIFWQLDEIEIRYADAVLLHVFDGKQYSLRGALIECGIAIALNKPVFITEAHPDHGTWYCHPSVENCANLQTALHMLRQLSECNNRCGNISDLHGRGPRNIADIRHDFLSRLGI